MLIVYNWILVNVAKLV